MHMQQSTRHRKIHGVPVTYSGTFTWDQGKHGNMKTMQTMCRQDRQTSHGG